MSRDELTLVLTSERDGYVEHALELAREELARREAAPPGDESSPADGASLAPVVDAKAPTRWWHVWFAVIAAASILNVIVAVLAGSPLPSILPRLFWALLVVPFFVWSRRTRAQESSAKR